MSSSEISNTIKLTLRKLKAVATWNYTSENQECLLCKKDLMVPVKDQSNNKVIINECNHGFHTSCINKWFNDGNTIMCPDFNTHWTNM